MQCRGDTPSFQTDLGVMTALCRTGTAAQHQKRRLPVAPCAAPAADQLGLHKQCVAETFQEMLLGANVQQLDRAGTGQLSQPLELAGGSDQVAVQWSQKSELAELREPAVRLCSAARAAPAVQLAVSAKDVQSEREVSWVRG